MTDTALALLAEAEDAICILSDSIRDGTVSEYYSNLRDRITALLDSGIKDAGDDVVEPELWGVERDLVSIKDYDTLLSAYKRACVEREQFRKDAERYRWLRQMDRCEPWSDLLMSPILRTEDIDEAIDRARSRKCS